MDQSISNISPANPPASPQSISTELPKKKPVFLSLSLIILFLGIIGAVGFYEYKNYFVKNQVVVVSPSPVLETTTASAPIIVFIRENNVWFTANGQETQVTTDGTVAAFGTGLPSVYYSNPAVSPDKKSIAYIRSVGTNTKTRSLFLASIDTPNNIKKIADDVDWGVDFVQWNQDASAIYYASPKSGFYDTRIIHVVSLATLENQTLGEYPFGSGCGGGSDDVADHLTWGENINGWPITFKLAPDSSYIIHSTNCTGTGIGLFDLTTKQDQPLTETERGVIFSFDGKKFAALAKVGISIYDTISKKLIKTIKTPTAPQALLFSSDGETIYFTTTKDEKTLSFDPKLSMDLLGSSPAEFRQLATTIWELPILSEKMSVISTLDAHNARPLYVYNQNKKLGLAVVDNATDLFNYYSTYKTKNEAESYFPKVNIVEIDTQTGEKTVIVSNAIQSNVSGSGINF